MARQIIWAAALFLLLPGSGRAAELREGGLCEKDQATQQRGGQPPAGHKGDKPRDASKDRPSAPRPKWWIDPKLRAELGITDQQSTAVEQIWQKSLPSLREGRQRLEKLEEALSQMTDTADEAAVVAQIDRVENLRADLSKDRTVMLYRMNKLLTADQRTKVKAMIERDRHDPPRRGSSSR